MAQKWRVILYLHFGATLYKCTWQVTLRLPAAPAADFNTQPGEANGKTSDTGKNGRGLNKKIWQGCAGALRVGKSGRFVASIIFKSFLIK